ncbi:hypothetical protein Pmani_029300 [Petrolisthes manimaculis]|uniref:Uncharacterized protein n=1 Tax=Petrolisthes manimaculis TaxID=1843537 RepID=A0AAE1NXU5_9EUCA|nr:hypothetical protein Pmani_029300 [Petrolisthes manimaculis]
MQPASVVVVVVVVVVVEGGLCCPGWLALLPHQPAIQGVGLKRRTVKVAFGEVWGEGKVKRRRRKGGFKVKCEMRVNEEFEVEEKG